MDNDDLAENEMEHWEDVRAQIVQAEDQAELYIIRNATLKSRDHSMKLPLLVLLQFAGRIRVACLQGCLRSWCRIQQKAKQRSEVNSPSILFKGNALKCYCNEFFDRFFIDLKKYSAF